MSSPQSNITSYITTPRQVRANSNVIKMAKQMSTLIKEQKSHEAQYFFPKTNSYWEHLSTYVIKHQRFFKTKPITNIISSMQQISSLSRPKIVHRKTQSCKFSARNQFFQQDVRKKIRRKTSGQLTEKQMRLNILQPETIIFYYLYPKKNMKKKKKGGGGISKQILVSNFWRKIPFRKKIQQNRLETITPKSHKDIPNEKVYSYSAPLKPSNQELYILPLDDSIRFKVLQLEKGVNMKKKEKNETISHNPFLKQKSIHFSLRKKLLVQQLTQKKIPNFHEYSSDEDDEEEDKPQQNNNLIKPKIEKQQFENKKIKEKSKIPQYLINRSSKTISRYLAQKGSEKTQNSEKLKFEVKPSEGDILTMSTALKRISHSPYDQLNTIKISSRQKKVQETYQLIKQNLVLFSHKNSSADKFKAYLMNCKSSRK